MLKVLLLLAVVAGGYLVFRRQPIVATTTPRDISDRAVADAITSGAAWADYWRKNLDALYRSVGNMPIDGGDCVPGITGGWFCTGGTPRPQSP